MHEQSLIKSLLTKVDAIRRQHDAEHVTEVRVEVGPLSGVEPLLLTNAFEQFAPASTAIGATLVIDEVSLLARCDLCSCEFELSDFIFRCPTCNGNVKVLRGDEVQLVSVSLQSSTQSERMVP